MPYTYVLWSKKLSKRYIGSADDPAVRLRQHNNGKSRFTSGGIPWTLLLSEYHPTLSEARALGGHAMTAARDLRGVARNAAYAAGQAGVVAHVAAHELGAAAYAIKAVRESVSEKEKDKMGQKECQWQRDQLPYDVRELVLDDQKLRNHICWFVFN